MSSKILIIFIAVLLLSISFLGGYVFNAGIGGGKASLNSLERFSDESGVSPTPRPLRFELENISFTKADSASAQSESKIIYISNGLLKSYNLDTKVTQDIKSLPKGTKILWGKNKSEIIHNSPAKNGRFVYLNIATDTEKLLHPAIRSAAFSPSGAKIAYHFFEEPSGEGSINISDPDGKNYTELMKTRVASMKISWLKDNTISFYPQDGDEVSDFFLLDIETKQLKKLLESQKGLDIQWSPSGRFLLYSSFNSNDELELYYLDTATPASVNLSAATFASKCAWANNESYVICGVPAEKPNKPTKPVFLMSSDSIVKVNLNSQTKEILSGNTTEELQVFNPFISPLDKNLFFINGFNSQLYRFSL